LSSGKLGPEVIRKTHPRSILAFSKAYRYWIRIIPRQKNLENKGTQGTC